MTPKQPSRIRPPKLGAGYVSGEDDLGEFHEVYKFPPGGSVVSSSYTPPPADDPKPADQPSPPDGRLPGPQ